MLVPDVNVLIYAHREDSTEDHDRYAKWLIELATGHEPFALSVLSLSALVRIVTNPRVFRSPSNLDQAFGFVEELLRRPQSRVIAPGPEHLALRRRVCRCKGRCRPGRGERFAAGPGR